MNSNRLKKFFPWFPKLLLINFLLAVTIFLLHLRPLLGCGFFLLLLVNFVCYFLLRPFQSVNGKQYIEKKEFESAAKLLRYATAVLSFLSLLTTANGMNSFVFSSPWLSYFGSFAVQSILVVFSLFLCHFYTVIGSVQSFSDGGKRALLGALTIFFSVTLLVSSSFSYSFIANYAYSNSWIDDREGIIQDY